MTQASSLPPELLHAFETVPDLYLILLPDLTILTASDAYLNATGKVRENIQGSYLFKEFPDNPALPGSDATTSLKNSLEWVLQHKLPHQMVPLRYDIPQPGQSKDFEKKFWRPSNTPVLDKEGNVRYIIHKVEDITEKMLAQHRMEQSQQQVELLNGQQIAKNAELATARTEADLQRQKLYNILMQAPAMICIFEGPQHVYKLVNPPYQQLVGERPLLGKPIAEAMPELAGQPIFELLDKVYTTGKSFHAQEMKVRLDHNNSGGLGHNHYNFTYQAIHGPDGNIEGIMVFAYEVTAQVEARRKVEQREQDLQALNEQLAAANEEIRAANEQLSEVQLALKDLNQELEKRIADRTRQLQLSKAETEAQQKRLEQLFMEAPAPIVILDGPEFVYELVNPAYQQIFPGRILLGKTLLQALPELEGSPVPALLENVYKSGETFVAQELPLMLSRNQGAPPEEIFWTFIYQARRNQHGAIDGVLVFAHEVTEQVRARQTVEQNAERLQLITDALPVLIGYLDNEERYQFANQAYKTWFDKDPKELLGQPVREVVGEKAYQSVKGYIERALAGERLDFDSRMPYREDFVKHIHTSYIPDIRDGKVTGFYILVSDVNEQVEALQKIEKREKEAQALAEKLLQTNEDLSRSNEAFQKLTQKQQQLVALVENSTDFIGLYTPKGKGVFINQAGLELVGLDKAQVQQVEVLDFFSEEDKPFVREQVLPTLTGKGSWSGELRFRHFHTGESIPVSYNCFSIRDPDTGELLRLASISIDITERKRQEATLQALTKEVETANQDLTTINEQLTRTNIDLDNFIYAASHDLKAPIFNIEGLMKILLNAISPEQLAKGGLEGVPDMIGNSIARFKRTIEHLTEVTKLQKENDQETVLVDLSKVIKDVRLDLFPQLKAADAKLELDIDTCPHIRFSEKYLRSVVYNLLSNAVKYKSPERTPMIRIRCRPEGEYIVVSVHDNGLGIELKEGLKPQDQKLFSMFGRLHDHVEGSGVGLYMVKRIVENADGRIEVESEVGVGSTFTVYFRK